MSKNFIYESFEDYLNYVLLMESEGGCKSCGEKFIYEADNPKGEIKPWNFQFSSGKFKESDITSDQLKDLENDFLTKIVPILDNPLYIGKKLKISLEAASSKVPIDPNGPVGKELKALKYTPDNEGLCKARAETVTKIIGDIIYKKYAPEKADKKKFLEGLKDKVEFKGVPKPNIGDEFVSGKDKAGDDKYKKYQYISANLEATGEVDITRLIPCNKGTSYSGGEANSSNGYIGYDKTVFLSAKAGQKVTIEFDSLTVPDSILFQYFGTGKISPFAGLVGGLYVRNPATPENIAKLDASVKEGKTIPYEKMKIQGKEYLVQNYKKYLNETANKGGVLVASIENKLKSLGLPKLSEICPEFFDQEGKIEVYATSKPEDAVADLNKKITDAKNLKTGLEPVRNTADMISKGVLAKSPVIDKTKVSIELTKNITRDAVTLVAFSPISGTQFRLNTTCS